MRILIKGSYIEIRIRCNKIENIVLAVSEPVLPSYIPPFDQHLVEAMQGSEIYISAYIAIIGTMPA